MALLLTFLPDQAMVLVFAGVGLALIVGLISRRAAFNVIGCVVLLLVLSPFIEALIDGLPTWILLCLIGWVGLALMRAASNLLLGRRSTNHMVGILAADVVRGLFQIAFAPLRWVFRQF
jgi:hypothetical protein